MADCLARFSQMLNSALSPELRIDFATGMTQRQRAPENKRRDAVESDLN